MKRSKFSDPQIVSILKQAEAGMPVKEVCRQHQISSACYYKWKSKFGGLSVSEACASSLVSFAGAALSDTAS